MCFSCVYTNMLAIRILIPELAVSKEFYMIWTFFSK